MADDLCKNESCNHPAEAHGFDTEQVAEGEQPTAEQRMDCHTEGCTCESFEPGGELKSPTANAPGEEPAGV